MRPLVFLSCAFVVACFGEVEKKEEPPTTEGERSEPCHQREVTNPPGCPENYNGLLSGEPCPTDGLECTYPGRGDSGRAGRRSDAKLYCRRYDGGPEWVRMQ
jgi:hypothetical protein